MTDGNLSADAELQEALGGAEPVRALKTVVDSKRPRLILKEKILKGGSFQEDLDKVLSLLGAGEEELAVLWVCPEDGKDWLAITWAPLGTAAGQSLLRSIRPLGEGFSRSRVRPVKTTDKAMAEAFLRMLAWTTSIVDPHFHYLDPQNLSFQGFLKKMGAGNWSPEDYLREKWPLPMGKGVYVEALPDDGYAEAKHVSDLVEAGRSTVACIVANCDLSLPSASEELDRLKTLPLVRGIRYIVDYDGGPHDGQRPTHANMKKHNDGNGVDFLRDPEHATPFEAGFALLEEKGLSFDLQCAPAQLPAAAAMFGRHPKIPVCLCHLGKPHRLEGNGGEEDKRKYAEWRAGMDLMQQMPQVVVKVSMLGYSVPGWHASAEKEAYLKGLVREVVELFGPKRCMFASNWHINDQVSDSDGIQESGPSMPELYARFAAWVAEFGLSPEDQERMFVGTATEFYKL